MSSYTVTDFSHDRIPHPIVRAWNEGDVAALEGEKREDNPYRDKTGCELREAWDRGFRGVPLNTGRHHEEALDPSVRRTVKAVRAQCGVHSWKTGPALHSATETIRQVA